MQWQRWLAVGIGAARAAWGAPQTGPQVDAGRWVQHLLPLPHEVAIPASVTLRPADIGIEVQAEAGPVQTQIQTELRALFRERAGLEPTGSGFRIVLGLVDGNGRLDGRDVPDAARLSSCPNSAQAYLIRPAGNAGLIVAALHERGLYYGAQTLRQLLATAFTRDAITVPLATVTDWPDMEERGIWNSARVVPFLASLKLNFFTYTCGAAKQPSGVPRPVVDPAVMALLRRHAMTGRVQLLHHLNYFDRLYGLYGLYPELRGQGDKAVCEGEHYKFAKRDIPVICASQPRWRTILTEMLDALGEQDVPEVSVWLSEFAGQCQCAECLKTTQVEAESRLVLESWQAARQKHPGLGLRIFFSQGDATAATAQALAALPPEVKVERVYSIYKPFLEAAQQGRWVLSFSGYDCIASPDLRFQSPEVILAPIAKGDAAKLRGVLSCSYPYYGEGSLPSGYYPGVYDFPLSAVAEWSWNVHGRTPRQFLEAWATRAGYPEPAGFADWIGAMTALRQALGQPRLPGAELPNTRGFRNPFAMIGQSLQDRQPIGLYEDQTLAAAREPAEQAQALAETLNRPDAAIETRYAMALLAMYRELNRLSDAIVGTDLSQPAAERKVRDAWAAYQAAVEAALAANARRLELWRAEPSDYVEKAQSELAGQWRRVQRTMDEAITALLGARRAAAP